MESINSFYNNFKEEWEKEAEDSEEFMSSEDAFIKVSCSKLVEFGILENPMIFKHHTKKSRLDAFEVRELGDRWQLDVVICDFNEDASGITEIDAGLTKDYFNQVREFLSYGKSKKIKEYVNEADYELFELALKLEKDWEKLDLVNIILISNRSLKKKIKANPRPLNELEIIYEFIGVDQFFSMEEKAEVANPDVEFLEPVPCISYKDEHSKYETVLAFIPGEELARIYKTWGTRLLENNVRAFLQVKGSVNKGIRETLKNKPEMFLAFNNGLAITAGDFVIEDGKLISIEDMQIVNGGQTTASIYHYRIENKEKLNNITVPAKIIKVPQGMDYFDIVKNISLYSNTQNKINASDLDANSPFQKKLVELFQTTSIPGLSNSGDWYYEQLRGGYLTSRNIYKTIKEKKDFDKKFPKNRKLEKADISKVCCAWSQLPYVVSLGSQKCFNFFRVNIVPEFNLEEIDESFFKKTMATVIIYKTAESIAKKNKIRPYTANIVAYTVSLLSQEKVKEDVLNNIWRKQELDPDLQTHIFTIMTDVQTYFQNKKNVNISEWAKKEICWEEVKRLNK